jgi:hypothetical protein
MVCGRSVHRLEHVAPPELVIEEACGAINIALLTELKNERNPHNPTFTVGSYLTTSKFVTSSRSSAELVASMILNSPGSTTNRISRL